MTCYTFSLFQVMVYLVKVYTNLRITKDISVASMRGYPTTIKTTWCITSRTNEMISLVSVSHEEEVTDS